MLTLLLWGCGSDSSDPVAPPTPPLPEDAPILLFLRSATIDPWILGLPDDLRSRSAATDIATVLRQRLPAALASRRASEIDAALADLVAAIEDYRSGPGFDPADRIVLDALLLLVDQAEAIGDGRPFVPAPTLRQDQG